jgi:hypothetical protein
VSVCEEDIFPVRKIKESSFLTLTLDIFSCPPVIGNELLELQLLLLVPASIDPRHDNTGHHHDDSQNNDRCLAGNVSRGIRGQEVLLAFHAKQRGNPCAHRF